MSMSKVEDATVFLQDALGMDVATSSPRAISAKYSKMQQINMNTVHVGMQPLQRKKKSRSMPSSVYELNTASRLSKLLQEKPMF